MKFPSARGAFWLVYAAVITGVVLVLTCAPHTAAAQTPSVVLKTDTALLIVKLPRCTTACPDSVRIVWTFGGVASSSSNSNGATFRRIARVLPAKAVDTVKVPRNQVGTNGVDFVYVAYKPSATKHLKLWPVDSVFEFYASNGTRISKSISVSVGDSIRALFVIVQPDLTRARPTTPVSWRFGDALVLMKSNVLLDTIWLRAATATVSAPVLTARFTVACQPSRQCVVDASTSTAADQPIVDYDWRWGDGRRVSASGPRTSVTYAAPGTYEVILIVSDAAGRRGTVTMSAVVPQSTP